MSLFLIAFSQIRRLLRLNIAFYRFVVMQTYLHFRSSK
ncbi:hypothetical protein Avbf_06573 [Armadillidium vulgare]|nr:hypothetical protein Avbf_06573 [Armadillidium vulgare]